MLVKGSLSIGRVLPVAAQMAQVSVSTLSAVSVAGVVTSQYHWCSWVLPPLFPQEAIEYPIIAAKAINK
jgi:hypothetical protein